MAVSQIVTALYLLAIFRVYCSVATTLTRTESGSFQSIKAPKGMIAIASKL